jgi:hypothetical protein
VKISTIAPAACLTVTFSVENHLIYGSGHPDFMADGVYRVFFLQPVIPVALNGAEQKPDRSTEVD